MGYSLDEKLALYREASVVWPRTYVLARLRNRQAMLRVAFCLGDSGHLVISAGSVRCAYEVARAVVGTTVVLMAADRPEDNLLIELKRVPQADWATSEVSASFSSPDDEQGQLAQLLSGVLVPEHVLRLVGPYTVAIDANANIRAALFLLGISRMLFYGYMTPSYYACHFRRERPVEGRAVERAYSEYQELYELAFTAAFKGIERFLGVQQVKASEIPDLLARLGIAGVDSATPYHRLFEVFSGHSRRSTFGDMIKRFLDVRNTSAAHSNRAPPRGKRSTADSVREVQHLLLELCARALGTREQTSLPQEAYLGFDMGACLRPEPT